MADPRKVINLGTNWTRFRFFDFVDVTNTTATTTMPLTLRQTKASKNWSTPILTATARNQEMLTVATTSASVAA